MNPAEDPLNDAEILFRQPGPPLLERGHSSARDQLIISRNSTPQ